MKRAFFGAIGLLIGGGAIWTIACSNSPAKTDAGPNEGGTGCYSVDFKLPSGTYPDPRCDPQVILPIGQTQCMAGAGKCAIEAKCGSQDTCLPLSSNAGKTTLDFRMRQLYVVAPQSLAGLQKIVIDQGIYLKNACGEKQNGTFSWMLRVDKTAGTLTTGGSPVVDPFGAPFCFYRNNVNGLSIQPVTVKITFNGKSFDSDTLSALNIPIFIINNPTPVILPVRGAKIVGATIDPDDCIGKFHKDALDQTCQEYDYSSCPRWEPAGALGGYITLDDADRVDVREVGKTLCVQLTGDSTGGMVTLPDGTTTTHCGHVGGDMKMPVNPATAHGDFCSKTNMPGGCQDSFWMAATFAASAAKLDEPSMNPECMGMMTMDAGLD